MIFSSKPDTKGEMRMLRRMLLALLLCAALLLTACGLPGALDAFSGADSAEHL